MTSVRFEEEEEKKALNSNCAEEEQEGRKVLCAFLSALSRRVALFKVPFSLGTEVALQLFFVTAVERRESRFSTEEDVNFRGGRRAPAQIWL